MNRAEAQPPAGDLLRRGSFWGRLSPAQLLLFASCLGVYVATRSISLDDFDSFNFARALDHFDVQLNQPHVPGYPVYVLLGRALDLATHDHLATLTLLSAVSGALTILVFSALARDVGCPWAALLLATMPLFWLTSEIALSDAPGLLFATTAVFLLVRAVSGGEGSNEDILAAGEGVLHPATATVNTDGSLYPSLAPQLPLGFRGARAATPIRNFGEARRRVLYLIAGAIATGLAAGVRPQVSIVPLGVLALYAAPRLAVRLSLAASLKMQAAGAVAFLATCLAWLLPLVRSFPSVEIAYQTFRGQSTYVGSIDGLFARPVTWPNLLARFGEFGDVLSAYFGGPRQGGVLAFAAVCGAALVLAILCRSRRALWLALAWLLPYAVFMLLTMRPDDPRKVLPIIPPLLLLFAGAFAPRKAPLRVGLACIPPAGWKPAPTVVWALPPLALTAFFGFEAAPLVRTLDTVKAPPVQAAEYIASNFDPARTLVIAGSSYNAVRYLLPRLPSFLLDDLNQTAVDRDLSSGAYRYVILLDKDGPVFPDTYVGTDSRTFSRDPLVLPKASDVWMAVYQPVSTLRPDQFALPSGPVHVGTRQDVRYLLDGWYRPEQIAGVPARWTAARSAFRFWINRASDMTLTLVGVSFQPGQRLTVLVNSQPAGHITLGQDWAPYDVAISAPLLRSGAVNTIELQHSVTVSPYDVSGGQSLDRRPLAVAYSSFQLTSR